MPQGYQAWLLLSRMYLGYGDLFGLQSPPMVVPTLDKLMSEAEPSGSVSWEDDSGFYVRSITPFPAQMHLGQVGESKIAQLPELRSGMSEQFDSALLSRSEWLRGRMPRVGLY